MKKLRFTRDEGTAFYKELTEKLDAHFEGAGKARTGNWKMFFKIGLYFGLDVLFYALMITATSLPLFYTFYLLMGLSVLLTAFNISHDAAHGVAVKSKFWNKMLFQLSFNLQGNNAYVWGKNHNESHHLYTSLYACVVFVVFLELVFVPRNVDDFWHFEPNYQSGYSA
ncbi:MAG: hypothetical protein EAZ95_20265 [Bacteroidetes bacterium]|nr:MAG: hypothetical protein EAZ95_20265 [Bacteroidota bacterium]